MFQVLFASLLLAQVAGPPPMMPMPGNPFTTNGLSVTGTGTVQAQASSVTLTLRVSSRANAMTITAASLQPIEDALVRAGVDRNSITLPPYLQGAVKVTSATITGIVQQPTNAMIKTGIAQVGDAFTAMPDLMLNSVEIRAKADNCEALTRQAQAVALRQARASAEYIASQLHVHVGSVESVQAGGSVDPIYGCANTYTVGPFAPSFPLADPQNYLSVRVYSYVTTRYAIRP